jgi:type I site-specific restriction endonuclease
MAWLLQQLGVKAVHVDGMSKDRAEILQDYADSKYQVLCNSSLLLEGYDCPDIACVIVLRPTKIRALYSQMIGRGTRIHPSKENLLILDFLWQTTKHDLCKPASLFAEGKADSEYFENRITTEKETDLLEVEKELIHEREQKLIDELANNSGKNKREIDPMMLCISFDDDDHANLCDYEAIMHWEASKPNKEQLAILAKNGFKTELVTSAGQATRIINRIQKRRDAGLCTPKQMAILKRYNIEVTPHSSFEYASKEISKLAANGWRKTTWIKKG